MRLRPLESRLLALHQACQIRLTETKFLMEEADVGFVRIGTVPCWFLWNLLIVSCRSSMKMGKQCEVAGQCNNRGKHEKIVSLCPLHNLSAYIT